MGETAIFFQHSLMIRSSFLTKGKRERLSKGKELV